MRTQTTLTVVGAACALLLAGIKASAADALPDFFLPFPPRTEAAEAAPIPLRPLDDQSIPVPPRQRRTLPSGKPPFVLHEGDRVLFLGDELLRGELEYGHLETRLTSQYPDRNVTFRNLSWLTDHPLADPGSVDRLVPDSWLEPLLHHAVRIRPTIVFLGFGTDAAAAGEPGLEVFRGNLNRLIDGLLTSPEYPPPRLVILGPLSRELATPATGDADDHDDELIHYAQALWEVAASRQCEFIDLYRWSQAEGRRSRALAQPDQEASRALTKEGLRLSQYGYWRMTLALERGLRWAPNHWRFGYLADGGLRDGQFGIELMQRSRSVNHVTARTLEARLPTPNPPRILDTEPDSRPQCYIQITGLDPGVYALEVDGELIVQGTQTEWARYQVISQGPSWDQAEQLRQIIVSKNALLLSRWRSEDPLQPPGDPADAYVDELESQITTLRKPVPRTYELQRVVGRRNPRVPSAASPPRT